MDRLDGWLEWCTEVFPLVESGAWREEFDWFGIDEDGILAVLTSAGSARFPSAAVRLGSQTYLTAVRWFRELAPMCGVKVWESAGNISNWEGFAERGLFAFDGGHLPFPRDYKLIAEPCSPLVLADLPSEIQRAMVRLPGIRFSNNQMISLRGLGIEL